MKKKKLKYIQPIPKTALYKRSLSAISVIGLSFVAVAGCCPIKASATVSEINLSAQAQSAVEVESSVITLDYSTPYDAGKQEAYNFMSVDSANEETAEISDFEYFFDEEQETSASVRYQKSELDADKIIKEAEKKKTRTSYSGGYSYISLNANAVPMSDMTVPDYINFDANGLPTNYSYIIEGRASAYCTGSVTATGTRPHQGSVAINPKMIPYGKMMYIVSLDGRYVYGYCRAEDTGGFVWNGSGRVADLYMNSYSDCMAWGVRGVRIYVF